MNEKLFIYNPSNESIFEVNIFDASGNISKKQCLPYDRNKYEYNTIKYRFFDDFYIFWNRSKHDQTKEMVMLCYE